MAKKHLYRVAFIDKDGIVGGGDIEYSSVRDSKIRKFIEGTFGILISECLEFSYRPKSDI